MVLTLQGTLMLFEKYKNEAEFRDQFIRPLLTRLGFLSIAELDGPQEFGKDFVFSELTPFGFMRHYAVVAKHERSVNQPGRLCETILSQIKQAFSVKFHIPGRSQESYVSSVLVMSAGNITANADTWLRSELHREKYGENVHIFSGERLSQLDNSIAFNQQQSLIPKLLGLKSTLNLNKIIWKSIETSLPLFPESRGCFTHALEDYVSQPFLTNIISLNDVSILLQECRIIDSINSRYLSGIRSPEDIKENDITSLKRVLATANKRAEELFTSIDVSLSSFKPIYEYQ